MFAHHVLLTHGVISLALEVRFNYGSLLVHLLLSLGCVFFETGFFGLWLLYTFLFFDFIFLKVC